MEKYFYQASEKKLWFSEVPIGSCAVQQHTVDTQQLIVCSGFPHLSSSDTRTYQKRCPMVNMNVSLVLGVSQGVIILTENNEFPAKPDIFHLKQTQQ